MKELCICEEIFRLNGKNDQNETLSSDYSSLEEEYYFEIEFDESFAGVSNWSLGLVFRITVFREMVGYIDVGDGCWRSNLLVTSL